MTAKDVIKREDVVIKFVGDSGDGMQLTGTLFSDTSALDGNVTVREIRLMCWLL